MYFHGRMQILGILLLICIVKDDLINHCCGKRLHITKYSSTLYIGMDEVLAHYACTFETSDLHFNFQC